MENFQPPFAYLLSLLSCIAKIWKILEGEKCHWPGSPLWASIVSWKGHLKSWLPWRPKAIHLFSLLCEIAWSSAGFSTSLWVTSTRPLCLSPYTKCPKGKNDDLMLGSFRELFFSLQNLGSLNSGYLGSTITLLRIKKYIFYPAISVNLNENFYLTQAASS